MQKPELTQEQSDRLAEALIDDVLADALLTQQAAVQRCRDELQRAERALGEIRHVRADWTRHRELDYSFGEQVVTHARLADFTATAAPPGTHVRAVRSYFQRHPPTLALDRLTPPRRRGLRRIFHRHRP